MAQIQYFLGANSPTGFYSLYDHLIDRKTARAVYLIKGGPGCGKSSLMRRVARHAEAAGLTAHYVLCSGDPGSLDAVVLPELGAALVDATAPHVIEPELPGVVDRYIDLSRFYDSDGLQAVREQVARDTEGYRRHYKRCYRCLSAAAELDADVRELLLVPETREKLAKRARGIIARELRGSGAGGPPTRRFLSAVTHAGQVCCWQTVEALSRKTYVLCDSYGLSHALLSPILEAAQARDFAAVACPDPMDPQRLEHLFLPELELAFVTSRPGLEFQGHAYRRLRLDSLPDREAVRRARPRIRFTQKVSAALKEEAVQALAGAKAQHDALEAHYNPYVDFQGVYRLADELAARLIPGGVTADPPAPPAG